MDVRSTGFPTALIIILLTVASPALAQEVQSEPPPAHWAYASIFGTGWYEVENSRSVFVLDIPMRHAFGESGIAETGKRSVKWEFHYPVTLGLHRIDDFPGFFDVENFGSISFMLGVETEIPVTARWYLRPYIKAGMGFDLGSSENAWIYSTGIKSRYRISGRHVVWDFLAKADFSGFDSNKGENGHIGDGMIGVEASHAWPWSNAGFNVHWHFTYTNLHNGPEYKRENEPRNLLRTVDDVFELGLAFSPSVGPYQFWLYKPERLGLALQVSPDGDYFAIRLNTRSWFTR